MVNYNTLEDQVLINNYIKGDDEAINTLIERYRQKIYNYILILVRDTNTADDIFQELFIKIISSLKSGKYADNGKFSSWVLRIAHNMVIDHFRVNKQKGFVSTDGDVTILNNKELVEKNIEDKLISEQTKEDVRKMVDFLPVEQREVVILRHYMGMSFKEIAEQTGVSINTALGRMRYALLNMRKMISDHSLSLEFS
ncbi:MAG: sigma-70 family RNA polymerase sigma factor [Rikenellaceae bacterium]|nr:sigma-70 family RNA polymerase sigma factor [Rikenellaceae bacterium]